jgi:DNA-binding transcriptional ArsR family regulator
MFAGPEGDRMARQAKAAKNTGRRAAPVAQAARAGSDHVQSLSRALALLNRISEATDGGATLTELAQQVGLPPSTAHRLLTTLEQERYVRFDHDGRLWSIGVQPFAIGCTFTKTRSLVGLSRAYMRGLMEESGETVNLAIEDQGQMVHLAQVECRQMMRAFARPGSRRGLPTLVKMIAFGLQNSFALSFEQQRSLKFGYSTKESDHQTPSG